MSKAVEVKYYDRNLSTSDDVGGIAINSLSIPLNNLSPWDTDAINSNANRNTSREGNSIVMRRFQFKGTINFFTNVSTENHCRVRLFIVHCPDSSQPSYSQVMQYFSVDTLKKIKPDNPYRVIWDRSYNLSTAIQTRNNGTYQNSTAVEPFRKNINIDLKFKSGLKTTWAQGASTNDPIQGSLTLMAISDQPNAANSQKPQLNGYSRLRFVDQ